MLEKKNKVSWVQVLMTNYWAGGVALWCSTYLICTEGPIFDMIKGKKKEKEKS